MAEGTVTDTVQLNPETAEFVPQGKASQTRAKRGRPWQNSNRNRNYNVASHPSPPLEDAYAPGNPAVPPHGHSTSPERGEMMRGGRGRGGGRRGRGRGDGGGWRGGDGGRSSQWRGQAQSWTVPSGTDGYVSNKVGGQDPGQESQRRPPTDGDGGGLGSLEDSLSHNHNSRGKKPNRFNGEANRGRGKRGSGRSWVPDLQENQKVRRDPTLNNPRRAEEPLQEEEHEDGSHRGWRSGDRPPTNAGRRSSATHPSHGNWRERETPLERGEREERRGAERNRGPSSAEELNRRGTRGWGTGQGPPQKEQVRRRLGTGEQRGGQAKRMELAKSQETQTGCLIEQLSAERYECMVCCEVVRLMAPVWSCQSCYHVFHLNCIKKWARSPASQADDGGEGWRCPACQNVVPKVPNSYTCFCGKVTNPEWQRSEIPHSCGDMCGKKRSGGDCSHPCNILCHPGPCPQCPAFITRTCVCGRTSKQVRCSQTLGLRCEEVCGSVLNCREHTCSEVCHSGPCQPCQRRVRQVCYCGVASREVLCGTDKDHFDGTGHFSCHKPCGKALDCQAHQCEQECHSGGCPPCALSPRLVRSCPCGQTVLTKLLELGYPERRACTDPVPSCGKTCSKPLPCGSSDTIHLCERLCHEGGCGPCSLTSTISCRCGSKTTEVPCSTIQTEEQMLFTCERRCSKKRSCGRHKCGELCCVDQEHRCSMICGYKLNCGQHRCQEPCHRGNCPPCWQTSFDELPCHCGQTVLYPPIPCGTKPPECKNLCTRRHECSHPVFHNCHSEETCPPCTYLTQKWCMGNHEQRSNIPCHLQDISCGLPCEKALPCGAHRCRRICHRAECQADGVPCKQPCLHPRPECRHPCSAPCHPGTTCPNNTCSAKVALQCDCGRRKETVPCTEAASSYQRYAAIAVASKLSDLQLGESVDIGQLTKKQQKQARLECDQECATLERNRRLAEALQIDQSTDPFNVRSSSKYSDSLKEDARKEFKFVSVVETEIKNLVELANKGKQLRRSHCFPPMNRDRRRMVHELAEAYGMESVSYDSEPKRNVVVTAVRGKTVCPHTTLTALIERETTTRAPPPIAHLKQHGNKADGGGAALQPAKGEPIDYFDVQD